VNKKKGPSNPRMRTYLQRQKERGLVNVSIWVPQEYVSVIRRTVDQLRRESGIITKRSQMLYGDKDV
jgi:hypothetical protein